MGIISEVKCGRCDRRYSALRSRCPYCGARRNKRGKHAEESDNSKAKLVVGALLILILIVAIVVLVATSVTGKDTGEKVDDTKKDDAQTLDLDSDVTTIENKPDTTVPDVTVPTEPTVPDEPEEPDVDSLTILYNGGERTDITMSVGDVLDLDYEIMPEDSKEKVTWSSSDEDVIVVLQTGEVTAVGSGTANLVISAGDVKAECIVRVP